LTQQFDGCLTDSVFVSSKSVLHQIEFALRLVLLYIALADGVSRYLRALQNLTCDLRSERFEFRFDGYRWSQYVAAYIQDAVEQVNIVDMELYRKKFQTVRLLSSRLVGITIRNRAYETLCLQSRQTKRRPNSCRRLPPKRPDLMLSYPQIDVVVRGKATNHARTCRTRHS
jgi:hypothetical protein